jgi:hypothetical protein
LTSISGTDPQFIFSGTGDPTDQRQLILTLAQTADWYKFTLPSDRTAVQLDTSTFADGPGEFVNTLDPHIQLYDAAGNLIATGSPLADGRNETIRATGLTPGATYYVRVTAENNTTGEYVLGVTPLRTPTVTSTVDDAPHGAEDSPDGEFKVPNSPEKGWTHVLSAAGFQGDYTIHAQNASPQKNNFAEWDIRATSANPELFATWVALPGNATNATYQVFAESSDGAKDRPLLTVVVDQTRGPSDALLFGTTLAQSLGSVNLPDWKPGTMLTVRLLTQGANGNVVADGVFDPPAGSVTRQAVAQASLPLEPQEATAILPSAPAVPASAVPNDNVPVNIPAEDSLVRHARSENSTAIAHDGTILSAFNDTEQTLGPVATRGEHATGSVYSTDGGKTFTDADLLSTFTTNFPFFTSTDNGHTFGTPVNAFPNLQPAGFTNPLDKLWMTVDNLGGRGNGAIYVTATDFADTTTTNLFFASTVVDMLEQTGGVGGPP